MKSAVFCLLCALLLTGCVSGNYCVVTAHSVPQPVSCTSYVYNSSGQVVAAQPGETVRHVMLQKTRWSMWYIPLNSRKWDVSSELNDMLKKTPGNAVVNVTVAEQGCNDLQKYFATWLPVIPCYVHVVVQGDIVNIPDP